jgi:prophage regulatory protein
MTHHLVGVTEIGELLQLSRQRADQLSRTKGFPDPVAELSGGRVWNTTDVEEWARRVKRHLCMPVGGPVGGRTLTEPCEECGRVWEWQRQAPCWKAVKSSFFVP